MNIADKSGKSGATAVLLKGKSRRQQRVVRVTSPATQRRCTGPVSAPEPRLAQKEKRGTTRVMVGRRGGPGPTLTAGRAMLQELRATGAIGMWKDRTDIKDSSEFARELRTRSQAQADRDAAAG
jgi:hypothetical protein